MEAFKGGQSNPTYKLITPARSYVMRAKPGPAAKLLPSAHAIEREYAVMHGLHGTEVPVPRMYCLCEDEAVIGRAFYVMEFMPGRVLWEQSLPDLDPAGRRAIYLEMNRVIAALHKVDYTERGLADYGKPGNYVERQIGRWSKQYRASADGAGALSQPIPEMEQLIDWLPAHLPASARDASLVSIVHGDYRLDNLMFHPSEPRVIAVLDWELSTLGHPLADFAYHCMAWHIPPGMFRGIGGLDLAALGIPSEDEYIAPVLRAHRPGHAGGAEGRLELLPGLQHVPHRRHPAGHRQAGGKRHGLQRAGAEIRRRRTTHGRHGLAVCPAGLTRTQRINTKELNHGLRLLPQDQGTAGPPAQVHGRAHLSQRARLPRPRSRPTPPPASAGRRCS